MLNFFTHMLKGQGANPFAQFMFVCSVASRTATTVTGTVFNPQTDDPWWQ
jgi:hypothetical protein